MNKKIILIGGAPAIGKTYVGRKIAKELGSSLISTDTIRWVMRKLFFMRKKYPHLSKIARFSARDYLTRFTPEEIMHDHISESADTWNGVKRIVKSRFSPRSLIIEGMAILPELVRRDFGADSSVKPIFFVTNRDRIREIIFGRGLWDKAAKYDDDLKKIEVEWVFMFNEWMRDEAIKYGYPVYEIKKWDESWGAIKDIVAD